jgi:positive regulator of sigma E activity
MKETGKVIEVRNQKAIIAISFTGACVHCAQANICNWTGEKERVIEVLDNLGVKPGDTVIVETKDAYRIVAIGLIFCVPIILAIVGMVIGYYILSKGFLSIILASIGFVGALGVAKLVDKRMRNAVRIVKKI